MNAPLIAMARAWLAETGRTGGVVVLHAGRVAGWMSALRDPRNWEPGCVAVDAAGRVWVAKGGNAQDGAQRWEAAQ